jgi:hypothetical protein
VHGSSVRGLQALICKLGGKMHRRDLLALVEALLKRAAEVSKAGRASQLSHLADGCLVNVVAQCNATEVAKALLAQCAPDLCVRCLHFCLCYTWFHAALCVIKALKSGAT